MTYLCVVDMFSCMRTTIDIDDRLLALAKKKALADGTTLRAVVESALRLALYPPKKGSTSFQLKWKTVRGKRLPGVDPSDRDSLYEKMEGRG